jgi:hypothetical protein
MNIRRTDDPSIRYMEADAVALWCYDSRIPAAMRGGDSTVAGPKAMGAAAMLGRVVLINP